MNTKTEQSTKLPPVRWSAWLGIIEYLKSYPVIFFVIGSSYGWAACLFCHDFVNVSPQSKEALHGIETSRAALFGNNVVTLQETNGRNAGGQSSGMTPGIDETLQNRLAVIWQGIEITNQSPSPSEKRNAEKNDRSSRGR